MDFNLFFQLIEVTKRGKGAKPASFNKRLLKVMILITE